MYADPTHIRSHAIKVSLNTPEFQAAQAVAAMNGMQPAVLLRELFVEFLASRLHSSNSAVTAQEMRATH